MLWSQHLASDNAVAAEALDRVTGIDISATALVRGRKTLEVRTDCPSTPFQ
jgi:predicted hydrolase (HD superfamily)